MSEIALLPPLYWRADSGSQAQGLATRWGFAVGGEADSPQSLPEPLVLWLDGEGLSVRQTGAKAMGPVFCDFATGEARHRRLFGGGKSQAIAKAVGIKDKIRPTIADLTAGLGGDACALAGLGCRVVMVERQPVVAALLADGLQRARGFAGNATGDEALAQVVENMGLVFAQAADWLAGLADEDCPDVIYLDPMFPARRKSALVNKNMQIFHQLVGKDDDADALLPLALSKARYRVVVKRPAQAPWLHNQKPGLSMAGKSVRFDIYPLRRMG